MRKIKQTIRKIFKKYEDKNPAILWHWWYWFNPILRNQYQTAKHFRDFNCEDIPKDLQPYLFSCKSVLTYKMPRRKMPKEIIVKLDSFTLNWIDKNLKHSPLKYLIKET